MKILYAIQGTGNGHLSRARDIIPALQQKGELDILVSGIQADVEPGYPVKYRLHGLSFIFGKRGGVDLLDTYKKNKLKQFHKEIASLPVEKYDLVINDFEPVSAWACRLKQRACIGLSHQSAILNENAPRPETEDIIGKLIIQHYAPTDIRFGFHFREYDKNIFTPVIRRQIREIVPTDKGYYTVYLPAYHDKRIIKTLSVFNKTEWVVFSKHTDRSYKEKNMSVFPVSNQAFIQSIAGATGVLCGAGFETPAEVLYLKKKLMVIPMKNQYEQQCNAASLKQMGVPVLKSLKIKHSGKIQQWINCRQYIPVEYPDHTSSVIDLVMDTYRSLAENKGDCLKRYKL
jgi:uncharacterized protein (TIGR00661 family)